ncbi:hypothetical protein IMZ38_05945 [Thermosphaera chiliense]|uniref:ATPase n=1 Tax=Thermosphaera chiliense TaxID=3402707 RepID=A0A7M1UQA2_9CREN|nr:hypothetical protein [Thermosphaera aggregans]QOR94169.1 hypothetical protein IMZ38_05945 [Thermosphaera aggregans]
MKKTILVSGLLPFDSGKTWFTLSLFKTLTATGAKAVPYKPVAAHNIWYSAITVKHSVRLKMLVGNDAYAYFRETGESPALLNPVALAVAPLDPSNYGFNMEKYLEDSALFLPQLVMARIAHHPSGQIEHFIIQENVEKTVTEARRVLELLKKKLQATARSLKEISEMLVSRRIDQIVASALNSLLEKYDVILLESFNDALLPSMGLIENVDQIIIVAPGKAFLYDTSTTKNILQHLAKNLDNPAYLVTSRLLPKFKPEKTIDTPVLLKPREHSMLQPIVDFILKE